MTQVVSVDVAILGAGAAGCAAAMPLLQRGLSVALVDRGGSNSLFAESLAPNVIYWLDRLCLVEAIQQTPHVASPGIVSLWNGDIPYEMDYLREAHASAFHVERSVFTMALVSQVKRAGARFCHLDIRDCRLDAQGTWRLNEASELGDQLAARWVIDATGRRRWFAARRGARTHQADGQVARVAGVSGLRSDDLRLVIESLPDGWCYFAPLSDRRGVVGFVTDRDLMPPGGAESKSWRDRWKSTRLVGRYLQGTSEISRPRTCAANIQTTSQAVGRGWIAVGDAALAHSPLSGEGTLKALETGYRAAKAILAYDAGNLSALHDYQVSIDSAAAAARAEQARLFRMVSTWPESVFWQRRTSVGMAPLAR